MRFSDLDGARVGVWGAGREIRSLATQLARRLAAARIAVAAFDGPPPADVRAALAAERPQELRVVGAEEAATALAECDVVVRSPGVPTRRAELCAVRDAGVPVTTATSLWLAERSGRGVIGVTGTKGKSTTAALIAHLARAAGLRVGLAGNIGVPALDLLDRPTGEPAVVELSSYQLADLATGPQVAVVVSLFPEHVDWHGSDEAYREDKLRLASLRGVEAAVVNGRDARLAAAVGEGVATTRFGVPAGWDVAAPDTMGDGRAGPGAAGVTIARAGVPVASLEQLQLRGAHNALNLCAALAALEAFGVEAPPLPAALAGFAGLPHRLEVLGAYDGVTWVDDSISTTPESALAALASFPGRELVLIGGGQDRRQDYGELGRALAARGAAVLGLPTTGGRLVRAARSAGVPADRALDVADLEAAVWRARRLAPPGGVVLLSPAAPSYGAYRDFVARGTHFRALVERMGAKSRMFEV